MAPLSRVLLAFLALSTAVFGQERHVIVLGIDGLSVDAFAHADIPHLKHLLDRSAWTLEARGVMPTLSSPNWESMITGAGTEQHGITSNGWFRRMVEFQPVCQGPDGKFPTVFDALHAQRPHARIAIFHEWGGFANLVSKRSVDTLRHEDTPARTTDAAVEYWKRERPALLFVHLDLVDHAGHSNGWTSSQYYSAVAEADRYIGRVLAMLDQAGAADSTFLLVTSDHGGTPRGHGKNSLAEIQIPWILSGPGVLPGRISGQVNTFDTAATLAWIFGLDPLPCAIGRPVAAAFRPQRVTAPVVAGRAPGCAPEKAVIGSAVASAGSQGSN